jgi:PAS domain S-box-containing protein
MGAPLTGDEYRVLVEQAPMLIWRADRTGACDYFNDRWLAFRGRSLAQEAGSGWAEGVHPDDFDVCLKTYLDAFGKREIFEMEYRLQRYDRVYRWIFDRGAPFYENGEFGGYVGSCVDVTERVAAQQTAARRRLDELKELRTFLPICCCCRKIRDEYGAWMPIEDYVTERSRTEFSHGMCPKCYEDSMAGLR